MYSFFMAYSFGLNCIVYSMRIGLGSPRQPARHTPLGTPPIQKKIDRGGTNFSHKV
jgi:hypothetical protein